MAAQHDDKGFSRCSTRHTNPSRNVHTTVEYTTWPGFDTIANEMELLIRRFMCPSTMCMMSYMFRLSETMEYRTYGMPFVQLHLAHTHVPEHRVTAVPFSITEIRDDIPGTSQGSNPDRDPVH